MAVISSANVKSEEQKLARHEERFFAARPWDMPQAAPRPADASTRRTA